VRTVKLDISVQGRPILAHVRGGASTPTVLALGGVHGDEPKSVTVARRLIELLDADPHTASGARWVVIPVVNPDGYARRRRRNARQVDINRNFPTETWKESAKRSRMFGGTAPASEPETRAVIEATLRYRPARIVSIHSIDQSRHCNNYDGPGRAVARLMARFNGYPVVPSMGYPTPGSLGTWAGVERDIPTITLELPSHHSPKRCWEENRRALLACAQGL
jgi:protein MpaA